MKKISLCVCSLLLLANFFIFIPKEVYNDSPYQTVTPLYDKPVQEVERK